jgi:hypothetical protein
MSKLKVLVCILMLMTVSTSYAELTAKEFGKVSQEELDMSYLQEDSTADAVILFDIGALSTDNFVQHKRVKVFTKGGTELANISIPFYKNEKIKDLEAWTYTKDGRKYQLDAKAVFTKKGEEDLNELVFAVPGVEEGCVFEYRYKKSNNIFLEPWYFQNEIFTKRSQFTLVLEKWRGYYYQFGDIYSYFFKNPRSANTEPQTVDTTSGRVYTWVLENVPPIKPESYVTCINDYRTVIYFELSGYEAQFIDTLDIHAKTTWIDWGKSADPAFKSLDCDTLKIKEKSLELTLGLTTDSAKAERIYDFVLKNIHWNEERGVFRISEKNFKKILTSREGTATEINLLLLRLMKSAGIVADPVLISTRNHGKILKEKPGRIQFNHMIVRATIDGRYWFLDAINKHCPFGMLPEKDVVDFGLLLKGNESGLIKISPVYDYSLEYIATKARLREDGGLVCTTTVDFHGYISIDAREKIEKDGKNEFVKQELLNQVPNASPDTVTTTFMDSIDQPLDINISFSVSSYASLDREVAYVNPTLFMALESNPFNSENRQCSIDFPYTFTRIEDTELQLPNGFMVKELPANASSEIPGGKFNRTFQAEGDHIKCHRQLTINRLTFPVEQYRMLRNFYQDVVSADHLVVTLVKEER